MKRAVVLAACGLALAATVFVGPAKAIHPRARNARSGAAVYEGIPWNGPYYKVEWGMPVALVVPPTAECQTNWGWGVGNTRVTTIYPQFTRNYPGEGIYNRALFTPTPQYPSDTTQFGVYYVRGPW